MAETKFSHETRRASFRGLIDTRPDMLVIGGGITGAGIAREAALQGLKVGLIEGNDFSFGTSSRSSKLIHGGLRYLEQFAFGLVRNSSLERKTLHDIAPHLCIPLGFHLPLYRTDRHSLFKLRMGLLLYDALCSFTNFKRHQILRPSELSEQLPFLRKTDLRGGGFYYDALTNDARLTVTTLRSATAAGAMILNRVELLDFVRGSKGIEAARVRDLESGEEGVIHARIFINATGPWVDRIRRMADPSASSWLRLSKGSHIVIPRRRLPVDNAVGFSNPADGRTMFIIPWEGRTLVGTTETDYPGEVEDVRPTREDVEYLLSPLASLFPDLKIGPRDVVSSYSGLRPLVGSKDGHASDVSREHRVEVESSGLLTVAGGKLTTYREMGYDVVNLALRQLGIPARESGTERLPLVTPSDGGESLGKLSDAVQTALLHHYGLEAGRVAAYTTEDAAMGQLVGEDPPLLAAQIRFAIEHEMALHLTDVLQRRIPYIHTSSDLGEAAAPRVAAIMATHLGWSSKTIDAELAAYREQMLIARPHPAVS